MVRLFALIDKAVVLQHCCEVCRSGGLTLGKFCLVISKSHLARHQGYQKQEEKVQIQQQMSSREHEKSVKYYRSTQKKYILKTTYSKKN